MEHTPTPWNVRGTNGLRIIYGENGSIAEVKNLKRLVMENDANAEFIVRACNSHEALLEACKIALSKMQEFKMLEPDNYLIRAIAKAKGK